MIARNFTHLQPLTLACLLLSAPTRAQDAVVLDNAAASSMAELRVVLKGENGEPVVGAAVMPYAMRVVEQDGHGFWDRNKLGVPKDYLSDNEGVAVIRYPSRIDSWPPPKTTKLVTFKIRHSDYVQEVVHFELGLDLEHPAVQTEVKLKKGCELQLSAIDENEKQITDFGVLMAGPYAPAFWADDGAGGRRTSAVSDGSWQTMLVKPQVDGQTLFSGLLPLRVRPSQVTRIRNVKLSPGTLVVGRLSDNVPRPIAQGYVMTTAAPKPAGESWDKESPSLCWHEWTTIAEDGTFELPSIPQSGEIQIIAICDGWVSRTTVPDALIFVMGQLFAINGERILVTIQMEHTGTIELTVLKPDGSPLESGNVSSSPNQRLYKGGSTLLGRRFRSLDLVHNQLRPLDQKQLPYFVDPDMPFLEQPIKKGSVVLRGIPVNRGQHLALVHDEFQFPTGAGFQLDSAEPKQMTIKVVPFGKTVGE